MSSTPSNPSVPAAPARRTLLIAGLGLLLLLLLGAGAAAWMLNRPSLDGDDLLDTQPLRNRPAPIFVPLEQFTVNLADPGGERLAQVGVTLETLNAQVENALKAQMPAVRNSILLLLSDSHSRELLTVAGKQKLARRIAELTGQHLGWQAPPAGSSEATENEFGVQRQMQMQRTRPHPIQAVHFSHFIIQ